MATGAFLDMSNVLLQDNAATAVSGGAIFNDGGTVSGAGVQFSRNTASARGGAAFMAAGSTVAMPADTTFQDNTATIMGPIALGASDCAFENGFDLRGLCNSTAFRLGAGTYAWTSEVTCSAETVAVMGAGKGATVLDAGGARRFFTLNSGCTLMLAAPLRVGFRRRAPCSGHAQCSECGGSY